MRTLQATSSLQPSLPTIYFDVVLVVGDTAGCKRCQSKTRCPAHTQVVKRRFSWPKATQDWWAMLSQYHPLAPEFTRLDWSYLAETALIHAHFWKGDLKLAPELRLREAKYGFTPEDRARLRLTFAVASVAEADAVDRGEAREAAAAASSRDRARGVHRLPESA